jgi:hypothetical protein
MTVEMISVVKHPNAEKNWRHVTIRRNGEQLRAVCFDGPAADGLTPGLLPESWSVKDGTHGRILEPPRKPGGFGGGGGFRNSEPGARLEQDRLDARMAAQLACRAGGFDREVADEILAWLKASR